MRSSVGTDRFRLKQLASNDGSGLKGNRYVRAMRRFLSLAVLLSLTACAGSNPASPSTSDATTEPPSSSAGAAAPADDSAGSTDATGKAVTEFQVTEHEGFNEGWALEFLPGTDELLVAERVGAMKLRNQTTGEIRDVAGMPVVHHKGQAGMHDVIPAPSFESDGKIYMSWVEMSPVGPRGIVALAKLDLGKAELLDMNYIWKQDVVEGDGHFSLRLLVHDDHLYVTSGDRQKFAPAQDHGTNLGKTIRLDLEGVPAKDNPFGEEGVEAQFWTLGHRNALGIDVDVDGNIWASEMGPKGGDELNLIVEGENYGWPEVSQGVHYDDEDIPDHSEGDGFMAPKVFWTPSISPGSLEIYEGELFKGWRNSALLGGLSGKCLIRVALDGENAEVAQKWDMGERIRAVEEAPDGSIWLLQDGADGKLLELRPA